MINKKIIFIVIISFFLTIMLLFITINSNDSRDSYTCTWYSTDWSACTTSGTQTRVVTCKNKEGGDCDDSNCTSTKPPDKQNCNSFCKVSKNMDFTDIPSSKPCILSGKNNKPAYTIFIRHCDRGYSDKPHDPNPPPTEDPKHPYPKRTTCTTKPNTCEGCQYQEAEGGCASNDCSIKGINRSWALGKWINCFANDKGLEVTGILGQTFISGSSNQRPTTTATIIYESLVVNFGKSPCYMYAKKGDYTTVKSYLQADNFKDKIVVIVWDHGQLQDLIKNVTGISGINWEDCCFDKVAVMNYNTNKIEVYNTKSLEENDLCGTVACNTPNGTYKTCSFSNFGNQTPCSKIS